MPEPPTHPTSTSAAKMIVITGGAGFIGSNLIRELNGRGIRNIMVVDDMTNGAKFRNLVDCKIADFVEPAKFLEMMRTKTFPSHPRVVFHYAAAASTELDDGKAYLEANFTYPKEVFNWCKDNNVRFIYASSAAVYGYSTDYDEDAGKEEPMNVFGYFKMLFDQYVLQNLDSRSPQVVGLRLFDVYGPGESHKGENTSIAHQFYETRKEFKVIQLYGDYDGYKGGHQKRDYVHVQDVARLNCWFLDHPEISGIYNAGTGVATSFRDLATEVALHFGEPEGYIKVVDFPAHLRGFYQSYMCANTKKLRRAGSTLRFRTIKQGIEQYMEWLEDHERSQNTTTAPAVDPAPQVQRIKLEGHERTKNTTASPAVDPVPQVQRIKLEDHERTKNTTASPAVDPVPQVRRIKFEESELATWPAPARDFFKRSATPQGK